MKTTKTLYGNQSFERLRDNNCFVVYFIHIDMLREQLRIETEPPYETYDIYTKMGYVDYATCTEIESSIDHWYMLIEQAKEDHEDVKT